MKAYVKELLAAVGSGEISLEEAERRLGVAVEKEKEQRAAVARQRSMLAVVEATPPLMLAAELFERELVCLGFRTETRQDRRARKAGELVEERISNDRQERLRAAFLRQRAESRRRAADKKRISAACARQAERAKRGAARSALASKIRELGIDPASLRD